MMRRGWYGSLWRPTDLVSDEKVTQQLPEPRAGVHPHCSLPYWKAKEDAIFGICSPMQETVVVAATEDMRLRTSSRIPCFVQKRASPVIDRGTSIHQLIRSRLLMVPIVCSTR
ncbi:unnamed protein product [Schistocephalus solidus]|uniref:Uncharacterized protein n=1 Tax=Schistocephalus solidus TaxID=70667 RepID=A0A183TL24_SCHSO|nr:unnamed protein product [Schistocephalus solidus]